MARKILLADDSVTAQNMGRRILTDAGYDVITVNNGSAALKKITEQKPDVIVLDVYMPGYGGLEVCQRIKETHDTARIPVLLTVGKLEPFKPEEARRARADAFIVKPFEASELLAALTKLEDKIVPQSDQKGRSKKQSFEDFGDTDTGWKNRLSVPPPHPKKKEAEDEEEHEAPKREPEPVAASKAPEPEVKQTPAPEAVTASAASSPAVPADISADEIAAIAAAAHAFQKSEQGSTGETTGTPPPPPLTETKTEPEKKDEVPELPVVAPAVVEAPAVAAESATPAPVAATDIKPVTETKLAESEVVAALESLSPTNGAASVAPPPPAAAVDGPRWIAEEVEVAGDDATFILEQEMEKALAAIAAAESARSTVNASATLAAGSSGNGAEVSSAVAVAEIEAPVISASAAPIVEEATGPSAASLSAVVEEAAKSEGVAGPSTTSGEPPLEESVKEQIVQAAAAAVGATIGELTTGAEAQQSAPTQETAPATSTDIDAQKHEVEPSAAWEHWRTVRDSVIGGQAVQQDDAAEGFKDIRKDATTTPAVVVNEEAKASPDAIANIVDSVLAELKPKLMEQIAKKLADDKK